MQNAEKDFIYCILLRELYNLINKTYCTRVLYDRTAKTLKRMGSQDTGPRILLLLQQQDLFRFYDKKHKERHEVGRKAPEKFQGALRDNFKKYRPPV